MADRTPTPQAVEFGSHLTQLREAAGRPSYGVISRTLLREGGVQMTDTQIGNLHAGKSDPRAVRGEVLVGLCRFYNCSATDLGPVAAAEIAALRHLTASDEAFAWSRCTELRKLRAWVGHHRARRVPVATAGVEWGGRRAA